jgi:hypothetical protein
MTSSIDRPEETTVNIRRWILAGFLVLPFLAHEAVAQGYAGDRATSELVMLIDKPTAGMLKRAQYRIGTNFYEHGGVMVDIEVGLLLRFSFGIAYGGSGVIGSEQVNMNTWPGVKAKLRLVEEGTMAPAIAIGFDSQGKGPQIDSLERYTFKSPGFYAVASKNYQLLGNFSIHGGINYSLERGDGDKDLNFYVGAEKSIGEMVSFLFEYDFAINDSDGNSLGLGRGYMNLGLRLSAGEGFVFGFDYKDVLSNQKSATSGVRTLQIDFIGSL